MCYYFKVIMNIVIKRFCIFKLGINLKAVAISKLYGMVFHKNSLPVRIELFVITLRYVNSTIGASRYIKAVNEINCIHFVYFLFITEIVHKVHYMLISARLGSHL